MTTQVMSPSRITAFAPEAMTRAPAICRTVVTRYSQSLVSKDVALERLEAMVATADGFELAERDLEIRGEGQLIGARQSGLSDLRFTRLGKDTDLLEQARCVAGRLAGEGLLAERVDALLHAGEHLGDS